MQWTRGSVFNVEMFVCPRRRKDTDQRQVPRGLHRPPAAGAGEGVPLQQVHHDQEEGGARHSTQSIWETGTPVHTESWRKSNKKNDLNDQLHLKFTKQPCRATHMPQLA